MTVIFMGDLKHHGVKGMKWGVRRYQNKDGSLTAAGKKRVQKLSDKTVKMHTRYKQNVSANEQYKRDWSNAKKHNEKAYYLRRASDAENRARHYRDSSKRMIEKISKIDPALGKKLMNKYSSMLNKTMLGDFTLRELKVISEHPDKLTDKAKKYIDDCSAAMMQQRINDTQTQLTWQMNQQAQMEFQRQIDQQIQMQVQLQIQQQIQNQIDMQIHQQSIMLNNGFM